MSEVQEADAGAETTARLQSNTSVSEYAKFRRDQLLGQQPNPNNEVQEEVQEETDVPEEAEEVSEVQEENQEQQDTEEVSEENVLSNIDLDDLSDEELNELSEKLGSRAVARFGELTAKRKAAEAELATLREKLQSEDNPLRSKVDRSQNPYGNINDIEELQKAAKNVEDVIEWAEDILFNSDEYSAEDVVTKVGNKEYTKSDIRKQLMTARKAEKKFLPAQLEYLQTKAYASETKNALNEQMEEELPWIKDNDSDVKKKYDAMLEDPRLKGIEEISPDLAAQLPYILAHSANSLYGRKLIKETEVKKTKRGIQLNPPSTAPGSAKSEKQVDNALKAMQAQQKAFRESGTKDDFIKMRTLRYSQ
jgi:hypothetical protein